MPVTLKDEIRREIEANGPITVARFIERALYEPGAGYYTSGPRRAGSEWLTGPTLHPIFGWTLARGLAPLLDQVEEPTLVEVGAGSGELTRDLCYGLHDAAPDVFERLRLVVVDRSKESLARARTTLDDAGVDLDYVTTSTELPEAIEGVVITNELLDAFPVHLCEAAERGPVELYVAWEEGKFELVPGQAADPTVAAFAQKRWREVPVGSRFEVPADALAWYARAARSLRRGALVTIDYGALSRDLVRKHHKGTLHAYHEGLRSEDFLFSPGQLDITYLVPFDLVAQMGEQCGLATTSYVQQGELLRSLGIGELVERLSNMDALAAKKLIEPGGAGGTFKVLVQARDIEVAEPWPSLAGLEGPVADPGPI